MKKVYALIVLSCLVTSLLAQKVVGPKYATPGKKLLQPARGWSLRETGSCDTLVYPVPDAWGATIYFSTNAAGTAVNGFITGNNAYGDQEKAAYYDASLLLDNYLTKVWIAFGIANTSRAANLTKVVPVHVYDGTSGTPGALLGTVNTTLGSIKADVDSGLYTEVVFDPAITLPASKKFFVSVDVSSLTWSNSATVGKDSLAIYASDPQVFTPDSLSDGYGVEKYSNAWTSFGNDWGADFSLVIHPFICTDAVQPIRLQSFAASRQNNQNIITWTTGTEGGNKGFTLERSTDGVHFTGLATIATKAKDGNSSSPLTYSYSDKAGLSAINYYRLKQTDINGKETYSSIVSARAILAQILQLANLWPSPAAGNLHLLLASPASDKVQIAIADLSGRMVMQKTVQVNSGDNNITLNVQSLAPGTYILRATGSDSKALVRKFVKQ